MKTEAQAQSKSYKLEDWRGGNRAFKEELDYAIENIDGEIPSELTGTLYRNVPAMLDVNGERLHHPFDADGNICAISFCNRRAHFRNRYVKTEGYLAEREAGKILYRGVFGTEKSGGWLNNALDFKLKNVANTNVIYWGGELLALWEASHAHRLNPLTLETLGVATFNNVLPKGTPFSAHPMVDPGGNGREPRLVNFGLKVGLSTTVSIYELNMAGEVVEQHQHSIPGFTFIHDFAITPNYCLLFQNPLFFNPIPFALGLKGAAECIKFLSDKPTKIWLIPRDGTQPMQELEIESGFIFHHANAFELGDEIIVDSVSYQDFPALDHELDYNDIRFESVPPGQLWRYRLNLKTKSTTRRLIDRRTVDFPYIHPNYIGRQHRWIYIGAVHQPEGNAPLQAILKINPETGAQQMWSAAPKGFVGEPVFVSRPNATEEDDGWVLTVVYDAENDRSDIVILNGKNIDSEPLAKLHLKHHLPYGLHGSFAADIVSHSDNTE